MSCQRIIKKNLAKRWRMFYPFAHRQSRIAFQAHFSLTFFFSCVFIPTFAFADIKKESVDQYRLEGFNAQQRGVLVEALSLYAKALALDPARADILNDVGIVYETLGMDAQAEDKYLEALRVKPDYLPAYMNLAYLYERRQDLAKASEYLLKRILLGKNNEPWTQKARAEYVRLEKKLPSLREKRLAKEVIVFNEEVTEAIQRQKQEQKKQAELKRKEVSHLLKEAKRLHSKHMYAQAIDFYDEAIKISDPDQIKEIKEAQHLVEIDLKKSQLQARSEKMIKSLELGDTASAKQEIRKMLAVLPDESNPTNE